MANTRLLTVKVEDHVRGWLAVQHGVTFEKQFLTLSSGGRHEFDAVSIDGSIVASIKSNSGLTRTGKVPDGKIKNAFAEVYFLSLVEAAERWLVLTSPNFYKIFSRVSAGKLAEGVKLMLAELPLELQAEVDMVQKTASREVSPIEVFPVLDAEERDPAIKFS